jgi:hypothetical protein
MEERVNPIRVTDEDTKETYTLDFNRESVVFMAQRNFTMDDLSDTIAVKGEELWYYAFRANHKKMSRNQTDKLYEKMGGLAPKLIKRLIELYYQALNSNKIVQDDDDLEANPHVTVEL